MEVAKRLRDLSTADVEDIFQTPHRNCIQNFDTLTDSQTGRLAFRLDPALGIPDMITKKNHFLFDKYFDFTLFTLTILYSLPFTLFTLFTPFNYLHSPMLSTFFNFHSNFIHRSESSIESMTGNVLTAHGEYIERLNPSIVTLTIENAIRFAANTKGKNYAMEMHLEVM